MVNFLNRFFKKRQRTKNPEDYYEVFYDQILVRVDHPQRETEEIMWDEVERIDIITTGKGPFLPDVWLVLIGNSNGCSLPLGTSKFEEIYEIVSKYKGFNFENYIKAMSSTVNQTFNVWNKAK